MYCGLFGRCCYPRPRTCNCFPQQMNQQKRQTGSCIPPGKNKCMHSDQGCSRENDLLIKNAAFGGVILPDKTDRRATYHVASLNLNTSGFKSFLILFDFSCNIMASAARVKLRFHLLRQVKGQCFSVPISTGILFFKDRNGSAADCFTLTACDLDTVISTLCNYSVNVEIEELETEGGAILANPVLIATIVNKG